MPFCHDEPPVYLKSYDKLFSSPKGIIYNTSEEKDFIIKRFRNAHIPSITTGIGLDIPPEDTFPDAREIFKLNKPFILYMGRVDAQKGCNELFILLNIRKGLIVIAVCSTGKEVMPDTKHKDIISLDLYLRRKSTQFCENVRFLFAITF